MKTRREAEAITGLNRRKLQEYDRLGIVHPTEKREQGELKYWYYDDFAILKLLMIAVLSESGFERSEIKDIILGEEEADKLYQVMMQKLDQKRKVIAEMISTIDLIWGSTDTSINKLPVVENFDITKLTEQWSFKEGIKEAVETMATLEGEEKDIVKLGQKLVLDMVSIGIHRKVSYNHIAIQECVSNMFNMTIELYYKMDLEGEIYDKAYIDDEVVNVGYELIDYFIEYKELGIFDYLYAIGGDEMIDYIKCALDFYKKNYKKVEEHLFERKMKSDEH